MTLMQSFAAEMSASSGLRLHDAEPPDTGFVRAGEQRIAGLSKKIREVDRGERIGAENIEPSPDSKSCQDTARAKNRHRAFEAAKIQISNDRSAVHARYATPFRIGSHALVKAACLLSVRADVA